MDPVVLLLVLHLSARPSTPGRAPSAQPASSPSLAPANALSRYMYGVDAHTPYFSLSPSPLTAPLPRATIALLHDVSAVTLLLHRWPVRSSRRSRWRRRMQRMHIFVCGEAVSLHALALCSGLRRYELVVSKCTGDANVGRRAVGHDGTTAPRSDLVRSPPRRARLGGEDPWTCPPHVFMHVRAPSHICRGRPPGQFLQLLSQPGCRQI
jgi:hypothetical protein